MTPLHSHAMSVEGLIEAYGHVDLGRCAGCRQSIDPDERPAVISYWQRPAGRLFYRVCGECVARCTSEKHLRRLARAVEKYLEPAGEPS